MDENEINKFHKNNGGKMIIRKAMKKYLPDDMHKTNKQGFSSPDQSWFRGESIEYVKKRLLSDDALIYKYFNKKTVKKIISEHLRGKKNRRLFIWSLLNFEEIIKINKFS